MCVLYTCVLYTYDIILHFSEHRRSSRNVVRSSTFWSRTNQWSQFHTYNWIWSLKGQSSSLMIETWLNRVHWCWGQRWKNIQIRYWVPCQILVQKNKKKSKGLTLDATKMWGNCARHRQWRSRNFSQKESKYK